MSVHYKFIVFSYACLYAYVITRYQYIYWYIYIEFVHCFCKRLFCKIKKNPDFSFFFFFYLKWYPGYQQIYFYIRNGYQDITDIRDIKYRKYPISRISIWYLLISDIRIILRSYLRKRSIYKSTWIIYNYLILRNWY